MSTNSNIAIRSAETVSAIRAVACKEKHTAGRCNDHLAKHFLGPKYKLITGCMPHRLMKAAIEMISPGSYGFIITRTCLFDKTLEEEIRLGIRQLVILGAGYDSRPFRFADQLKNIKIFELDFPGTQLHKRKRLARVVSKVPDNLVFIPIDFNKESFELSLLKRGFNPYVKTLFLWEGVSYYLPESVVKKVFSYVSTCASGSSIVFDYATKDFVNGDHTSYGGKQLSKWLKKINEPFLFGMNAGESRSFLHHCGLSLLADYSPADLEKLYLINKYGRDEAKTLGHVRMAHAKNL